jgi:hypothetical protein
MDSSTDLAVAKREIDNGESIPAVAGKLSTRNPNADLKDLIATANEAKKLVENDEEDGNGDEKNSVRDNGSDSNSDVNEESNTDEFNESPGWFDVDESEPPNTEQVSEDSTAGETEWSK